MIEKRQASRIACGESRGSLGEPLWITVRSAPPTITANAISFYVMSIESPSEGLIALIRLRGKVANRKREVRIGEGLVSR